MSPGSGTPRVIGYEERDQLLRGFMAKKSPLYFASKMSLVRKIKLHMTAMSHSV